MAGRSAAPPEDTKHLLAGTFGRGSGSNDLGPGVVQVHSASTTDSNNPTVVAQRAGDEVQLVLDDQVRWPAPHDGRTGIRVNAVCPG